MIYAANNDFRKSYVLKLTSSSVNKWFLNDEIESGECVGRGSYGKVYRTKRKGQPTIGLAKKVTIGDGRNLCKDFIREFGILEKLSRSTKPRDRLIVLVGVEISKDVAGM